MKLLESYNATKKLLSYDINNTKAKLKYYQTFDKGIDKIKAYFDSLDKSIDMSMANDDRDSFSFTIYVLDAKDRGEMREYNKKVSKMLANSLDLTTSNDITHAMPKYKIRKN